MESYTSNEANPGLEYRSGIFMNLASCDSPCDYTASLCILNFSSFVSRQTLQTSTRYKNIFKSDLGIGYYVH